MVAKAKRAGRGASVLARRRAVLRELRKLARRLEVENDALTKRINQSTSIQLVENLRAEVHRLVTSGEQIRQALSKACHERDAALRVGDAMTLKKLSDECRDLNQKNGVLSTENLRLLQDEKVAHERVVHLTMVNEVTQKNVEELLEQLHLARGWRRGAVLMAEAVREFGADLSSLAMFGNNGRPRS